MPHTGRLMVEDKDPCLHCGLCADRCPTAALNMRKSDVLLARAGRAVDLVHFAAVR